MSLSDFPTAAYHLIDSMTRSLRTADTMHAAGIFPSSQHHCPIALSLNTPESLLQPCGWLLQQCWLHGS
jgi:hypothetical protein